MGHSLSTLNAVITSHHVRASSTLFVFLCAQGRACMHGGTIIIYDFDVPWRWPCASVCGKCDIVLDKRSEGRPKQCGV